MVEQGDLGKLRYIYSNRASLGKVRTEENALWSFAPHDVSMILALSGRLPEKIVATGANYITQGVADTTLSHLSFSDDLQAHIFVSWLHPYKDHKLVVIGEDGMVVFDDFAEGDNKLLLYSHVVANKDGIWLLGRLLSPSRTREQSRRNLNASTSSTVLCQGARRSLGAGRVPPFLPFSKVANYRS